MDKLSMLQKLTGDKNIVDQNNVSMFEAPTFPSNMKASNVYEGTDSEDEEMIMNKKFRIEPAPAPANPKKRQVATIAKSMGPAPAVQRSKMYDSLKTYQLQLGELAPEDEIFCPWKAVKDYPFKFVGNANRSKVVDAFYSGSQYCEETWDYFYIHRGSSDLNLAPLVLVPTAQFAAFLDTINNTVGTKLTIPVGGSNAGFQLQFDNDGNPRPRYLGHSTSGEMSKNCLRNIPPSYYKLDGEPNAMDTPSARSLAAFKRKMDLMIQMQKKQKANKNEKRKQERFEKQQQWCHSIKRVQRYLGLREVKTDQLALLRESLEKSGLPWGDIDAAVAAAAATLGSSPGFSPDKPAPFAQENNVVFVSVDVEAWERNADIITEVGIATLDTRDLANTVPGKQGVNWMSRIRARHFRIKENAHFNNTDFVEGCADKFEFGTSEFIGIKDAPHMVSTCFKPPFSQPDPDLIDLSPVAPKRSIILVGHDVGADIRYLQKLGYDVSNLSNILETVDTASMWRYLKREPNPRSLGMILYELEIVGWHLHNAGNDAVYTLQAMLAIACKHLEDKTKKREDVEVEKKARISESIKEATEQALEKEEGWSSSGENSDGGVPISPPKNDVVQSYAQSNKSRLSNANSQPNSPNPGPALKWRNTAPKTPSAWSAQDGWRQNPTTSPKPTTRGPQSLQSSMQGLSILGKAPAPAPATDSWSGNVTGVNGRPPWDGKW